MPEDNTFFDFIQRIRAGDEEAAAELVRRYEPLIRREVRLRLEDRRLSRLFDSMDICQSVLGSFFVRAAAGQFDLDQPGQLVRLLATMARNKLVTAVQRQQRQRRDSRRNAGDEELAAAAGGGPSPSRLVAGKELWERFREGLSEDERQVADLRGQGFGWNEVAERLGGTPEARRKQLARAVERVSRELGLDEAAFED
jgi:RNA polymerase sigma-70 factor (ECF subfamily)